MINTKLFLMFFLFLYSASAFSMQVKCDSPENFFNNADVVFVGTVIDRVPLEQNDSDSLCWTTEQGSKCGPKKATFTVEKMLKGNHQHDDKLAITAGDACYCVSPYLNKGEKYLVFGLKTDKENQFSSMNACATTLFDERYLDLFLNRVK